MKHLHLSVIPAKAGIQWLQELRDPCRSLPLQAVGRGRDDGEEAFFDTLSRERTRVRVTPSSLPLHRILQVSSSIPTQLEQQALHHRLFVQIERPQDVSSRLPNGVNP